jgi:hypothetical protein
MMETTMLARRFTIVCLLMTLFGMAFAILVAEASRPHRSWDEASSRACGLTCLGQMRVGSQ